MGIELKMRVRILSIHPLIEPHPSLIPSNGLGWVTGSWVFRFLSSLRDTNNASHIRIPGSTSMFAPACLSLLFVFGTDIHTITGSPSYWLILSGRRGTSLGQRIFWSSESKSAGLHSHLHSKYMDAFWWLGVKKIEKPFTPFVVDVVSRYQHLISCWIELSLFFRNHHQVCL